MNRHCKKIFLLVVLACTLPLLPLATGCGGGTSNLFDTVDVTWINASWSGGAACDPTDRQDIEPPSSEIPGRCPSTAVDLFNYCTDCNSGVGGTFAGLNVVNRCTDIITLYLCVAKGSDPQPQNGLNQCATDPLQTDISQLKIISLTNGCPGDFVNATQNLDVNVFFCASNEQLIGPPLECLRP